MGMFDGLSGYKPEKVTDGFQPFKEKGSAIVNYVRIEDYQGEKEEFKGSQFFRYELVMAEGCDNAGRRLWLSKNITNEKPDKKGKTNMQKVADVMFTLGLEFTDMDSLRIAMEKVSEMTLEVNAYHSDNFKDEKTGINIQCHSVLGIAGEKGKLPEGEAPF